MLRFSLQGIFKNSDLGLLLKIKTSGVADDTRPSASMAAISQSLSEYRPCFCSSCLRRSLDRLLSVESRGQLPAVVLFSSFTYVLCCVTISPTCKSVYHIHACCPWRLEDGVGSPRTVVSCHVTWGLSLGPQPRAASVLNHLTISPALPAVVLNIR